MTTSLDKFLDGKLQIYQPEQGFRAGSDSVFIAAAVPAHAGENVLEVGAGAGAAMLCLAIRVPGVKIIGLEMQRDMVRLAAQNIKHNNLQDRVEILSGNLLEPPPRLAASSFAHVFANPPYFEEDQSTPSPYITKALSHQEKETSLQAWVNFCCRMVRPKGTVSFIFPTPRLDDLITACQGKLGGLLIYPLWPKPGQPSKRIIVQGRKNSNAPTILHPGLMLHGESGAYTPQAQGILRAGKSLYLD